MTRNASITPMWSSSPTPSRISSASSRRPSRQLADRLGDEGAVAVGQVVARGRGAPRNRNIVQMTLTIITRITQAPPRCEPLNRDLRPSLRGVLSQPDHRERRQADQAHDGDEVLGEAEQVPVADDRDRPLRVAGEEDAERLEVDRAEDHERPEHEEVRGAGHRPLEQLALREDLDDLAPDRLAEPLGDVLEPVGGGLAAGDQPEQEDHPTTGHRQRDDQHHQPDDQHPQVHGSLLSTVFPRRHACRSLRAPSPCAGLGRIYFSVTSVPGHDGTTVSARAGPPTAHSPPAWSGRNRKCPRVVRDLAQRFFTVTRHECRLRQPPRHRPAHMGTRPPERETSVGDRQWLARAPRRRARRPGARGARRAARGARGAERGPRRARRPRRSAAAAAEERARTGR